MLAPRLRLLVLTAALTACAQPSAPPPPGWPPRVDAAYPDLELLDSKGATVALSSLKGKVILLEPVGMTCPACNAFAGGNRPEIGHFSGIVPQEGILSTPEMLEQVAGVDFGHPGLVHVQLLLYNLRMQGATAEDAARWAAHFKAEKHPNLIVLAGGSALANQASSDMIPGYQVIDRDFILRSDCSGHQPGPSCQKFVAVLRGALGMPAEFKNVEEAAESD
ncbi:MAG: hypothetical protein AAB320_10230 [Elusimicrobiota bacterium]